MRKDKRSSTNLIFYFFSSLIFSLTLETRVTAEKFLWWPLADNLFTAAGTLSEEIRWWLRLLQQLIKLTEEGRGSQSCAVPKYVIEDFGGSLSESRVTVTED